MLGMSDAKRTPGINAIIYGQARERKPWDCPDFSLSPLYIYRFAILVLMLR